MAEEKVICICYINRDKVKYIDKDLRESGHIDNVEMIVPTVKVLKKKFKGEPHFEEVPLLFNYGFVRMPLTLACREDYLGQLREDISAIFAWVRDTASLFSELHPKGEGGNMIQNLKPQVGVASERELANLIKFSSENSIYSQKDIDKLQEGDYIVLKGYPFDNMEAKVISINRKKKEVKVKLNLESALSEITVSFDNVFYTIYNGYEGDGRESSLDHIEEKGGGFIDKIYFKNQ